MRAAAISRALLGATRADSEDLGRVIDRSEAVMLRHSFGPRLDLLACHLDGVPALSADQVVMVLAGATAPIAGLAFGRTEDVDFARTGKRLEVSVHGR